MTTQQQTTYNPWFMLGKGKGEKASCKCRVWKFWATDAICLKQTGGAEMSQVHSQWLLEDVVLSPMTKNSSPGSFFAINPKVWTMSQILQCLCRFLPCSQPNPSPDWDTSCCWDRDNPQGRWGTLGGWKSLPKQKISYFILPYNSSFAPFQMIFAPLGVKQSGKKQRPTAFVNKY